MMFTYQTRLRGCDAATLEALDAYADSYGRVERRLFAALQKPDVDANALKRRFLADFRLSSRQYNAIRRGLDGKIASIVTLRKQRLADMIAEIAKLKRLVRKLAADIRKAVKAKQDATKLRFKRHGKQRRLGLVQDRLAKLKADEAAGRVRLCFGSRKLFRSQFQIAGEVASIGDETKRAQALEEKRQAWREDWRRARSRQFFSLGSKDETAGNQSCQITDLGETFALKLRLPDALGVYGKHLSFENLSFAYGGAAIRAARVAGEALSYRFLRDDKGWRVFVSVDVKEPDRVSRKEAGCIGVDVNVDHLAVAAIDRFGARTRVWRIACVTYGKSSDQAKAVIGDAVKTVADIAAAAGKPLAHEALDFGAKKKDLSRAGARRARMLSSFAYGQILTTLNAACHRRGVEILTVNPAYTSVIGAVCHAGRAVSNHQGAAVAIARRSLRFREAPPRLPETIVRARDGACVTVPLPERIRGTHVWADWAKIRRSLSAALAAHFDRDRSARGRSPPGRRERPDAVPSVLCAVRSFRRDSGTRIVSRAVGLASGQAS